MQAACFSQILDLLLLMRIVLIPTVGGYLLIIFRGGWLRSKPVNSRAEVEIQRLMTNDLVCGSRRLSIDVGEHLYVDLVRISLLVAIGAHIALAVIGILNTLCRSPRGG